MFRKAIFWDVVLFPLIFAYLFFFFFTLVNVNVTLFETSVIVWAHNAHTCYIVYFYSGIYLSVAIYDISADIQMQKIFKYLLG